MADLVQVHPEGLEDPGGDALALADEPEQQVLRADVVVAEAAGLVDRELDDALGARRQADLADDRAVTPTDDELDGGPDLGQLDVHVLEHTGRDAFPLPHQAEQEVLGADVVVVEALGLVLRKGQDLACPVGELVELFHSVERPFPWCASSRRSIDPSTRFLRSDHRRSEGPHDRAPDARRGRRGPDAARAALVARGTRWFPRFRRQA